MLSFDQIRDLIYMQLTKVAWKGYIIETYSDHFIYSDEADGKFYKVAYTFADEKVTLGEKVEVQKKVDYVKVQAAVRLTSAMGDSKSDDFGYKWEVQIIEFGPDKQGLIYWAPEPLLAAKALFEGAKVFALTEAQHQAEAHPYGKSVRDMVGWLDGVTDDKKGFKGHFNILKSAKWLRDAVVDSWDRGKKDLIGLSVDVDGSVTSKTVAGKKMQTPVKIGYVTVDVVYDPAAGGQFIRMAAAVKAGQKEVAMLERLLAALKASRPEAYKSIEAKVKDGTITEAEVLEKMKAAMAEPAAVCSNCGKQVSAEDIFCACCGSRLKAAKSGGNEDTLKAAQKVLEDAKLVACGVSLEREINLSGLPELSQAKVKKQFDNKVFENDALKAAIKEEKEYIDKLTGSGLVAGSGSIRITEEDIDKRKLMFDDFFEGKVQSIKAAYVNLTGDNRVTGELKASTRLRASIDSTTFALALGDSISRRMLAEYKKTPFTDWRKIVTINPVFDFRTNRRNRVGGYGDLPTVGQGQPYNALGSPTNEEATYTPTKKGGTEDITLEAIKNDDVGAIRRIPQKLSRAAARTLYKFVFDMLATNPTVYDSVALFHASHGNLGSAALAAASFAARRQAMIKQTELNSGEQLGIAPKYMIVPVDLDKTGYDLIATPRNSDFNPTAADFTRTLQMELIVVPYWTDANNWFFSAAPEDIPGIEIGFLDGKEEPELFVQDLPNAGSMFNNDKLTYKLRHIYGGAVTDVRAFDGSIVA